MFGTIPTYTPTSTAVAVTLENIYDPTIFNQAMQEQAIELNRFIGSGIMQVDPRINDMASGPGHIGDLPFYNGLDNDSEPDYVDDDPTNLSTPEAVNVAKQVYATAHQHKSWSTMDLARELALQDPLGAIVGRTGQYWATNSERRVISTVNGVIADNIANDAGDMVNAVHTETGLSATAVNLISAEAVIDAAATMGDHASNLRAMAMHSVVYTNLQKQNLIDFIPNARGEVVIPTYLGYVVVVDDSILPRAGTINGLVYTTILFAMGAIAYGAGTPLVPSETDRIPGAGNGGGQDILHTRVTEIVHPYGYAWADTAAAAITATRAELAVAGGWDRVFEFRKNVGLAALTSNG